MVQKGDWDCQSCILGDSKVYNWSSKLLADNQQQQLFENLSRTSLLTRLRGLRGMLGDMGRCRRFVIETLCQSH